jgi:hypothetical protein
LATSPDNADPVRKSIDILLPDRSVARAELLLWDTDPQNPRLARIILRMGDREVSSAHSSYIHALSSIRRELEREGITVKCYGGSRNIWPSSASSSMGRGATAYKLHLGKRIAPEDLVSIFDSGPDVDPCTIQEQEAFHNSWLLSVGISPRERRHPWRALFFQKPLKTAILFLKEKLRR